MGSTVCDLPNTDEFRTLRNSGRRNYLQDAYLTSFHNSGTIDLASRELGTRYCQDLLKTDERKLIVNPKLKSRVTDLPFSDHKKLFSRLEIESPDLNTVTTSWFYLLYQR